MILAYRVCQTKSSKEEFIFKLEQVLIKKVIAFIYY